MAYGEQWQLVLTLLRQKMRQRHFDNWFGPDTITNVVRRGGRLLVLVADEFAREYLEQNFTALVQAAVFEATGRDLRVVFDVNKKSKIS